MRVAVSIISLLAFCSTSAAQLADGLYAAIDTSMGGITCRLDYAEAPVTCANFAGLAEGSLNWVNPTTQSVQNDPFYEDRIFHRVITNFVIQGGCPLGNGSSGPGYNFPDEFHTNLSHRSAGILSMANSGPNSNGSQFFITLRNTSQLDPRHAVFGEVIEGMNIIYDIGAVDTDSGDRPLTDVTIQQINILRIGTDAQNFDPAAQSLPEVTGLMTSISNTPSGIEISAEASALCRQTLFASPNITDWTLAADNYSQTNENPFIMEISSPLDLEYFKAVQVLHPQAATSQLGGHTLSVLFGPDTLVFELDADHTGSLTINDGALRNISSWGFDPSYSGYRIYADGTVPLSLEFDYTTSTNGNCTGFLNSGGWLPISGTFTDSPGQ